MTRPTRCGRRPLWSRSNPNLRPLAAQFRPLGRRKRCAHNAEARPQNKHLLLTHLGDDAPAHVTQSRDRHLRPPPWRGSGLMTSPSPYSAKWTNWLNLGSTEPPGARTEAEHLRSAPSIGS